jgi:IS5 family transposase
MKEAGFLDLSERQKKLGETRDFLEKANSFVNWEAFRGLGEKAAGRPEREAGGPPYDAVLMFKILVLQALCNMADEQTEYQILDWLSFMKFLGLGMGAKVREARTVALFRETLGKEGGVEKLFGRFDKMLESHVFSASGRQMVDATFVKVPRQRNNLDDNETIKEGKLPEYWSEKKAAYKDVDARRTKKNDVKNSNA